MAAGALKILLLLAAFCAGCAQLPSQCNGVDIPLTRVDVLITLSAVNCFRCDLAGGGITWTLDGMSIVSTATTFTNSDGTTSMASTVNSYLVLTNSQSLVTPGRAGRVDILCQDALNDEIDTRLLSPELADPTFSPQTVNEGGTLALRCINNVPDNVGTTEIFNPDGVSVARVTYTVEDVTRDKAGNYSCVVTAATLPNTTRTVFTTVTIRFQSTFPTVPGQGVSCTVMGDYFVCSALPGATVMLNCNVDANPPATVTFSPQGVNTVGNTIVLNTFTTAANYSCTATNEGFDPVTRNFRLVVGIDCPPYCTANFCSQKLNRYALCTIRNPKNDSNCDAPCRISYCHACYYSDKVKPTVPQYCNIHTCPSYPDYESARDRRCLKRWATCAVQKSRPSRPCKIHKRRFTCFEHPCDSIIP